MFLSAISIFFSMKGGMPSISFNFLFTLILAAAFAKGVGGIFFFFIAGIFRKNYLGNPVIEIILSASFNFFFMKGGSSCAISKRLPTLIWEAAFANEDWLFFAVFFIVIQNYNFFFSIKKAR